ncbi:E7 [Canis familiaris papillomavirus 6]|uniref:Protein E7 n=1 Tax=Canis familiaris papillomavirus 6 TaxID=1513269 RepID=C8YJL3_9PAPI|nr:E7 [Canis familiaris papillomavirus 6]ACU27458.1 E7 [Canis familiaris papillomavirus 6]AVI56943.1 early protein 7 [Canis familiaris papillomavirus 6]
MIGQEPTLPDIVLTAQLPPETVDLHCYEQIPAEEEEEEEPASRDLYRVAALCGLCGSRVRFVCLAESDDIRHFQRLLFNLSFVCLRCVKTEKLNHGG